MGATRRMSKTRTTCGGEGRPRRVHEAEGEGHIRQVVRSWGAAPEESGSRGMTVRRSVSRLDLGRDADDSDE